MRQRTILAGFCLLTAWSLRAEWTVEVVNGPYAHTDWVVSQPVTREWARSAESCGLAEVTGSRTSSVPCAVDASGEAPVLTWLMPGPTAPDATRRFVWLPLAARPAAKTDLTVVEGAAAISVSNGYFRLEQPLRGGGGFPRNIAFVRSGRADPDLFFCDRIVRARATGGGLVAYNAKDCEDAEARVVFRSPLRTTVEVRTGYGRRSADTPGHPVAVYRYVYTAFSPVVEVAAQCAREDDGPWREQHFLHLSRATRGYASFVTGDPAVVTPLQAKGVRSKAVSGAQWAVMADDRDACGVGFGGALCWDASDEFVYYVRRACQPWEGGAQSFFGGLYFGPSGDAAPYSQWLGRERRPEVRVFRDGKAWLPVERTPLVGGPELANESQRVVFGGADEGFDCLGIENRLAEDERFVRMRAGVAGLWLLTFKTPPDAAGKQESATLDNHAGAAASRRVKRVRGGVDFSWNGLDLPGEPGADRTFPLRSRPSRATGGRRRACTATGRSGSRGRPRGRSGNGATIPNGWRKSAFGCSSAATLRASRALWTRPRG